MDERLEKALKIANYNTSLYNQKLVLKEKYEQDLIYYHSGSKFSVTQDLISFCYSLRHQGQTTVWLVDDNDTPIEIKDLEDFISDITDVYFKASNRYYTEYNKLKAQRSVNGLIND